MPMPELMVGYPAEFMRKLKEKRDWFSQSVARDLDAMDPLSFTYDWFEIDENLIPFAGHSLGPLLKAVRKKINETLDLQKRLHAGHFPDSHPDGKNGGNWFGCDLHKPSTDAAKKILGFRKPHEFCFTAKGLSENLGMLMDTFLRISKEDWASGRNKIARLQTEFFSDGAIAASVMERKIKDAEASKNLPANHGIKPEDNILTIPPANSDGIYNTADIIAHLKKNIKHLKMICLPDIVFNTGQRLELDKILNDPELKKLIKQHKVKVILDLAHTVFNRQIDLKSLEVVTAAVGCTYKHGDGPAGSGFGIYVNENVDLNEFPPIQGWIAAKANEVFGNIHKYDPKIMGPRIGAWAFRQSNPPPLSLIPAQTFLTEFDKIDFDKCFAKSESLTLYLIAQLQRQLGDQIRIITPLDPKQRGATIAFSLKDPIDVRIVEEKLKERGFEIDTRPPNIIRMTAHYGYTKFEHIYKCVEQLRLVLKDLLQHQVKAVQPVVVPGDVLSKPKVMLPAVVSAPAPAQKQKAKEIKVEPKKVAESIKLPGTKKAPPPVITVSRHLGYHTVNRVAPQLSPQKSLPRHRAA